MIDNQHPTPRRRFGQSGANALLFCGLLICIACAWLGVQAAIPWQTSLQMQTSNNTLEGQLRRRQIQNQALTKEIAAMGTEEGIILAARQKGYMMPNERPLHVQK